MTMAKIHNPSDSECHTHSSEPLDSSIICVHFSPLPSELRYPSMGIWGGGGQARYHPPLLWIYGKHRTWEKKKEIANVNAEGLWTLVLALSQLTQNSRPIHKHIFIRFKRKFINKFSGNPFWKESMRSHLPPPPPPSKTLKGIHVSHPSHSLLSHEKYK
jgi:hypothetical protein